MSPLWQPWEIEYVRQWYGKKRTNRIASDIRRTRGAVCQMAHKIGVSKFRRKTANIDPETYVQRVIQKASDSGVPYLRLLTAELRNGPARHLTYLKHELWSELYNEGLTFPAIALASGYDQSTIVKGVHRARERLAQQAAE